MSDRSPKMDALLAKIKKMDVIKKKTLEAIGAALGCKNVDDFLKIVGPTLAKQLSAVKGMHPDQLGDLEFKAIITTSILLKTPLSVRIANQPSHYITAVSPQTGFSQDRGRIHTACKANVGIFWPTGYPGLGEELRGSIGCGATCKICNRNMGLLVPASNNREMRGEKVRLQMMWIKTFASLKRGKKHVEQMKKTTCPENGKNCFATCNIESENVKGLICPYPFCKRVWK